MDSAMMDTESFPAAQSTISDENESVRGLLTLARQLIHQGNPSQALHAVVIAMRIKGGDNAVSNVLNSARDLYRNKIRTSTVADDLASLFAECAIAEAGPSRTESSQSNANQSFEPDVRGTSILAETGRKQIMLDAFSDGSSFVCLQCGGLTWRSLDKVERFGLTVYLYLKPTDEICCPLENEWNGILSDSSPIPL